MTRHQAGFTVVELIITMTIMAILLTLGVVNLRSTQATGRDEERKTDVSNIALYLDGIYNSGTTANPDYKGSYPVVSAVSNAANIATWFADFDSRNLRAPNVTAPTYSITPATNATQTPSGVAPQPTINTYIYQPIDSNGALCTTQGDCRKFNLYYLLEAGGGAVQVRSKNQ